MDGGTVTLAKLNLKEGIPWRFGPNWPGQRCGAKTRKGAPCQRPALRGKTRCQFHGGRSTGPTTKVGLQRISAAQMKHGKYTKTELAKAKRRAETGRRILAELKRIEGQIMELGLMPDD
jgi:hypothetical protein